MSSCTQELAHAENLKARNTQTSRPWTKVMRLSVTQASRNPQALDWTHIVLLINLAGFCDRLTDLIVDDCNVPCAIDVMPVDTCSERGLFELIPHTRLHGLVLVTLIAKVRTRCTNRLINMEKEDAIRHRQADIRSLTPG